MHQIWHLKSIENLISTRDQWQNHFAPTVSHCLSMERDLRLRLYAPVSALTFGSWDRFIKCSSESRKFERLQLCDDSNCWFKIWSESSEQASKSTINQLLAAEVKGEVLSSTLTSSFCFDLCATIETAAVDGIPSKPWTKSLFCNLFSMIETKSWHKNKKNVSICMASPFKTF